LVTSLPPTLAHFLWVFRRPSKEQFRSFFSRVADFPLPSLLKMRSFPEKRNATSLFFPIGRRPLSKGRVVPFLYRLFSPFPRRKESLPAVGHVNLLWRALVTKLSLRTSRLRYPWMMRAVFFLSPLFLCTFVHGCHDEMDPLFYGDRISLYPAEK